MNYIIALFIYQSVMAFCLWHANGLRKFAGSPGLWLLIFIFIPLALIGILIPEFPATWQMDPLLVAPALRYLALLSLLLVCASVVRHRWSKAEKSGRKPAAPFLPYSQPEDDEAEAPVTGQVESAGKHGEAAAPDRKPSGLPVEQQQTVVEQLQKIMVGKKVFTDPDLTLEKLSALSGIPRHHISGALNQHEQKSFYQFVNEFRIAEVVAELDRCRTIGITPNFFHLALSAGFKAKSSFNHYFKSITGFTPTSYLKQPQAVAYGPVVPSHSDNNGLTIE